MTNHNRPPVRPPVYTLEQAVQQALPLRRLVATLAQSQRLWAQVQEHIPNNLRTSVQPGVVQAGQWTLLVPHNSAAAKLRQLSPDLLSVAQAQDPLRYRYLYCHKSAKFQGLKFRGY